MKYNKVFLQKSTILIESTASPRAWLTIFSYAMTCALLALSSDTYAALKGSVTIEADEAYFNQLSGKTEYSGDVVIIQDTMHLRADKVTVVVNNGKISEAIATGTPATLERTADATTEKVKASANNITYNISNEVIMLSGNALLQQSEGHELSSGVIRYEINEQRIKANSQGGRRVKITLPPDSKGFN